MREKLSKIVSNEPEKFVDIFERGKTELNAWTKKIIKWSLWVENEPRNDQ